MTHINIENSSTQ